MSEGLEQAFRHYFVVLAGVADVGEHLGEGLLVVDLDKMAILLQLLLIYIIGVDVAAEVVVIGLLMDEALQGQTVGEGRLFCGPADGERGDRHDETG